MVRFKVLAIVIAGLAASSISTALGASQILTGASIVGPGSIPWWHPPGGEPIRDNAMDPSPVEPATQIRMPKGKLTGLKVSMGTENVPDAGVFSVTVRINGADTALSCSLTAAGFCNSPSMAKVSLAANDRLTVRVLANLNGASTVVYTYSLLFNP